MRRILTRCLISIVFSAVASAQAAAPQTPSAQTTPSTGTERIQIAPGSVIPVVLTRPIDAKKAKTGDPVEAKVTQDLKADDGAIILAKDAKVTGHVNSAQPRSKEQKESQVSVVFDHIQMKGADTPLAMSIQAVVFPMAADSGGSGVSSAPPGGTMANDTTPGGRPSGMSMPSAGGSDNSGSSQPATRMPPVTGQTQGVVGNSNLKLAADAQGSVISSEKGNVKVEPGTLILLRVNQ